MTDSLAVGLVILAAMAAPWLHDAITRTLTARRDRRTAAAWEAHVGTTPGVEPIFADTLAAMPHTAEAVVVRSWLSQDGGAE